MEAMAPYSCTLQEGLKAVGNSRGVERIAVARDKKSDRQPQLVSLRRRGSGLMTIGVVHNRCGSVVPRKSALLLI